MEIRYESHWVQIAGERLHLQRILPADISRPDSLGPPVLLVHGSLEDGRIFYTQTGKGFAPYLARQGYDVYVGDLRGKGQSTPRISRASRHGQREAILEDIPAWERHIQGLRGDIPRFWGAHSWGGVLLLAAYARHPELRDRVRGFVFFGTKRSVRVLNPERILKIDLVWNGLSRLLVRGYGYLPARAWRLGAEDEPGAFHRDTNRWVREKAWIDPQDGFDYAQTLQSLQLPPALYLAGAGDRALGHPEDVRRLIEESGAKTQGPASNAELRLLSKVRGNLLDYGHIDMLTHPDAPRDHFPGIVHWMKKYG